MGGKSKAKRDQRDAGGSLENGANELHGSPQIAVRARSAAVRVPSSR